MRKYITMTFLAGILAAAGILRAEPVFAPEMEGGQVVDDQPVRQNLLGGFYIKFGSQTVPQTGGFGSAWLASLGYDFSLSPNFALGINLQPYARSFSESDFSLNTTASHAWATIKAGLNLGQVVRPLRFLTILVGGGGGGEIARTTLTLEGEKGSRFDARFGFMGLAGIEIVLGSVRLCADYQLTMIRDPNTDPNGWVHYLLFGIKF